VAKVASLLLLPNFNFMKKRNSLPEYPNSWVTEETQDVYETPWIKVTDHKVVDPGGNQGQYGVVTFKNWAIGIIPIDAEGNTWIVGQYRYPVDAYSWEIPAGGGKLDLPPLTSAKRELKEETGIVAQNWEHILEVDMSNSASTEVGHIFLARDLEFTEAQPDADEDLKIIKLPFQELYERVLAGEIRDSLTVLGVLKAGAILIQK
jgi:8-oxo-dGTP pyrophosphatase MutT (NUDIX family)